MICYTNNGRPVTADHATDCNSRDRILSYFSLSARSAFLLSGRYEKQILNGSCCIVDHQLGLYNHPFIAVVPNRWGIPDGQDLWGIQRSLVGNRGSYTKITYIQCFDAALES